jgi:hypothetical protein
VLNYEYNQHNYKYNQHNYNVDYIDHDDRSTVVLLLSGNDVQLSGLCMS